MSCRDNHTQSTNYSMQFVVFELVAASVSGLDRIHPLVGKLCAVGYSGGLDRRGLMRKVLRVADAILFRIIICILLIRLSMSSREDSA